MATLPKFLTNPEPALYKSGNYIVVDFETNGLDKGDALNPDNNLLLSVWWVCDGNEVVGKWKFGNEFEQKQLLDDIASVDFIVAHNAKFELQWLKRCGLDLHDVLVYDTMLAEYVVNGNRKGRSLELDECCKRRGLRGKYNFVGALIKNGVDPEDIPKEWLLTYCKQDVACTYALFHKQLDALSSKLLAVVYNRCLTSPCLADIEDNGATLDKDRVEAAYNDTVAELSEIEEALDKLCGGINLNSNHQLAHWLYGDLKFKELRKYGKIDRNEPNKQFPDGMPKTDMTTISKLVAKTKKQQRAKELLQKYSKLSAKLTKNLAFFKGICDDYSCHFKYKFNQSVTATHRLSSSGRNIVLMEGGKEANKSVQGQNFPREMKPLFCASGDDRLIAELDGSQLEFRVAGHLGRDKQILEDVLNDEDIHQVTADTLTEAGEPTSRQAAKASTFRPLFAGRSGSPAIVEYCDFFRRKYKGISNTQLTWGQQALETGVVETEWGLIFYFPHTKVRQDGTYTNFTNICNYPIQSFASAEITLIALVHFWHLSKDYDFRIINTIHDSIITDIPEDDLSKYYDLAIQAMLIYVPDFLKKIYGIELYIPLGCGIKVGKHWNDPIVPEIIPTDILGFETKAKDGGKELAFDMHRRTG